MIGTKFKLFQGVNIKALDDGGRGFIDAIMVDSSGIQVRVIYWHNGERKAVWMHEHEVEVRP